MTQDNPRLRLLIITKTELGFRIQPRVMTRPETIVPEKMAEEVKNIEVQLLTDLLSDFSVSVGI